MPPETMDGHRAGRHPVTSVGGLVQITRPQIALQGALYMLLGAYLGTGISALNSSTIWWGALTVGLIVAFGFVINDYADRELDRLSKAERPIPSGAVTSAAAVRLALLLAAASLVVAFALPLALRLVALSNLALAMLYALRLKRTVLGGNLTIAWLNCSVLLFGAMAVATINAVVWMAIAMSFFYSLAQEVLYTIDDRASDAAGGIVTTAVYFGVGPSLWLFRVLLLAAAAAGGGLLLVGRPSWLGLIALLLCTIMPIMVYLLPLTWQATPAAITQACRAVRLIRVSSLLPLLLLPGAA
jgi:geranylgeranylglycerol-phosphate geranylgeranyltransferase